MTLEKSTTTIHTSVSINVATTTPPVKSRNNGSSEVHFVPYQIFGWKGHGALNCYNRYNAKKFPHTHNHQILCSGFPMEGLVNFACNSSNNSSIWYLDFGASSYILSNRNIQHTFE